MASILIKAQGYFSAIFKKFVLVFCLLSPCTLHGVKNPIYYLEELNRASWRTLEVILTGKSMRSSKHTKNAPATPSLNSEEPPSQQPLTRSSQAQTDNKPRQQEEKKITFNDIAGIDSILAEIKEVVDYIKNPEKYKALGAKVPLGILLEGPPGVGKTLIARALANEAGCTFIPMSGSQFVEIYVGQGAARVRDLFAKASQYEPAIIFIDEIDAVGAARGGGEGGSREYDQTLNELLVQINGFQQTGRKVIIGATNRADILDPALKRPGRLTRILSVLLPDENARKDILTLYIKRLPKIEYSEEDVSELAKGAYGFSGAELEDLVNTAALFACRENASCVNKSHFERALKDARAKKRKRGGKHTRTAAYPYHLPSISNNEEVFS